MTGANDRRARGPAPANRPAPRVRHVRRATRLGTGGARQTSNFDTTEAASGLGLRASGLTGHSPVGCQALRVIRGDPAGRRDHARPQRNWPAARRRKSVATQIGLRPQAIVRSVYEARQ